MAIKTTVMGAAGKMGRALVQLIGEDDAFTLAGATEAKDSPHIGQDAGKIAVGEPNGVKITDDLAVACAEAQVAIDFTAPEASLDLLRKTTDLSLAAICGTTGFDEAQLRQYKKLAASKAVVLAPNMSMGVNLLLTLVEKAASILDEDYDIEIVETHHRHKKDAPSGTALALLNAASAGRGKTAEEIARFERHGVIGPRKRGEIGVQTLRGGDVVGDHSVMFAADGEIVTLSHRAQSRMTFARGALAAAKWIAGKRPGIYDMKDVLGLK